MPVQLAEAWKLAKSANKSAQNSQKIHYDRHTKPPQFNAQDMVFVYMPAAKACKPYHTVR